MTFRSIFRSDVVTALTACSFAFMAGLLIGLVLSSNLIGGGE